MCYSFLIRNRFLSQKEFVPYKKGILLFYTFVFCYAETAFVEVISRNLCAE